jgi:enoyl-CoA hydratase/carnithine racemase
VNDDSILVQRDGAIATVVLNRPDKLNALDKEMWSRLGGAMRELDGDASLRCVVLRGAGDRAFAAGADISEFHAERASSKQAQAYSEGGIGWLRAVAECRHPTLALIQGACVGGGLLIASQCDLRICNESARFGVPVKNLGLTESYDELASMLRILGPAASLEILLEGRIWGAREAYEKGLVSRVVPDADVVAEAYAAARRIAEGAPLVARWHKKFIRRLLDPRPLSAEERAEGYACFDTEDFRAGVAAFLAKRKPEFTGK